MKDKYLSPHKKKGIAALYRTHEWMAFLYKKINWSIETRAGKA